jgi:hypothetical protein
MGGAVGGICKEPLTRKRTDKKEDRKIEDRKMTEEL